MGLEIQLKNGYTPEVTTCTCKTCGNQWWVLAASPEFLPQFCCYCGVRINIITERDSDATDSDEV